MMGGGKTSWKAIQVRSPGSSCCDLYAAERLAALYRFQNGEPAADQGFANFVVCQPGRRDARVTDPGEVDWDTFPVLAALEAVTTDELRRLRLLLNSDDDDPTAPPFSRVQERSAGESVSSSEG